MNIYKNLNLKGEIVDIVSENGKIKSIGKTDLPGLDFEGKVVRPGLVEIHSHGGAGVDTMDADLEALAKFHARNGVTAFYPTTMTDRLERIKNVCNSDFSGIEGAKILGIHLEGPYINPKYKGAQNGDYIRVPDIEEFKDFKNVKLVTIAPEMENAIEFIKEAGVKISMGHSDADYDTSIKAIDAGADCVTHTLNAMIPLHHRNPGIFGAACDRNIYVQVISDGLHMHPAVVRMIYRLFGSEHMILISDSIRATQVSDGIYEFGSQDITVIDGVARTKDGAIAGSTSTLFDCVQCAVKFGIPEDEAYRMASETPARYMGINKGKIEVGYDCDLLVLTPDNKIDTVIIEGEKFNN